MISQTAEYALRAAVHLAQGAGNRAGPGSRAGPGDRTIAQIAAATRVPAGYLAKVMQSLCRAGIVRSQRGLGGGFRLALPAEELSVLRVVDAVDPIRRIEICPLGMAGHGKRLCPLHRRLDHAVELVRDEFARTTIAELAAPPRTAATCRFPLGEAPAPRHRTA